MPEDKYLIIRMLILINWYVNFINKSFIINWEYQSYAGIESSVSDLIGN